MSSAFTTFNKGLSNKLHNTVVVKAGGRSVQAKALWDTGATITCISGYVAEQLSLVATGKISIRTPSGESDRNTYLVDLSLPNNVVISDLVVSDSEIGTQGIGVLIGMDIINRGDFAVSNHNGVTVFTFRMPSSKRTDYSAEISLENIIGSKHGRGKRKKR